MKKILKKYNKPGKWEIEIPFEETGESIEFVGIINGREQGDYILTVISDHRVCGTKGRITVRAVAHAQVNIIVRGVIKINKLAQETEDFLELRVLMLHKTARANLMPELEIDANNVKASHAASIGQVDKEQICYLMGRGLSENDSKNEIIQGFLGV